jgi:hypothetical protein
VKLFDSQRELVRRWMGVGSYDYKLSDILRNLATIAVVSVEKFAKQEIRPSRFSIEVHILLT